MQPDLPNQPGDPNAEDAMLRASEARFHHTIDHMLEGVQIIGFDWRYRYLNDSVIAQARRPRAELLGRTVVECFPGIETTGLYDALQRCMNERVSIRMEYRFKYGDGSFAWFDVNIQPSPEGIVMLSVDCTARKRAEQELRYAADRLRLLADVSRAFADMGAGYQALLDRVARMTGEQLVAACIIRLLSDDGQWLDAVTVYDRDPDTQRIVHAVFLGERVHVEGPHPSAAVVRDGQPRFLRVLDPAAARALLPPNLWSELGRFQPISSMIVPIQAQGRNIGTLLYLRHEPGQLPFAEDDVRLSQELADRAALAISNARLYDALQHSNAALEARVAERTAELRRRTDLIDLASDAIIIRDFATDTVIYWNHGAERLYGWSSAEMQGRHIHTVLQTAFPAPLAEIKAALLRDDVWEGELAQRHRDGQRVDVASRWTVERDQDRQPRTLLSISSNITERKRMEAQLRQHAARATALAEIAQALAEISLDHPALFETLAWRVVKFIGEGCTVAMHSSDGQWLETRAVAHHDPEALALLRSLAATPFPIGTGMAGSVARTGMPLRLNDIAPEQIDALANPSYRHYFERHGVAHLLIVPIRVHGQVIGTLGVSRGPGAPAYTADDQALLQDIADRAGLAVDHARMFAEAQRARAEAEQANRAKSVFLTSLSHELRTPLNAILGFTGTMLMRLPGPLTLDQERQLSIVQHNGKHLLALINDLLDLAKIESGKVEIGRTPLVCQEVIADVANSLRPSAERRGLHFVVDVPDEPIVVSSDARSLTQILNNLIGNAIKFTDVGEVRVELDDRQQAADHLDESSAVGRRSSVVVRVRDTGIGIRAEDQARLFQEFGRVDSAEVRAREGTGLGLRLAHQLAALLGGRITVASEYGVGSTFTLELFADRRR